ncbi:MAG: amino acid adenylation domain-containing protein, partial [Acidobacteriota bacterium]
HDIGEVAADARSIPLGKPIANTRIYVLDGHGQLVPVGVEGEIHIGGDGVARGYLNRAELTAERFLTDPFRADSNARMYKSGDRGRWLADGTLEYLGRNDYQVKIRGFRIELGEIEVTLSQCTGVRDAVVLAREDAPGDKRLVAYLVGDEGLDLSVADLRDALSRQLPEHMLPSAFVQLDCLPLTANGKLDRRALPAPEATALSVREYEAPEGEIEQALAALWQELLRVERVGRHDQFFELGGHSLLAVQLVSQIRATLGVELPLRELFAGSSLSVLAEAVRAAGASTMGQIQRADRNQPLPLSLAQQRLWFLDQLDPAASAAYHMPAALRLLGQLDVAALQATLDRLVARHEGLRTSFVAKGGVPYQQIAPEDRGFALSHEDLSSLSAEEREALVARLTVDEARAPFDLSTGPLIRGCLLCVSDDEHVLLVTQHHIVTDGWSVDVMVREVAALYTAFHNGEADPLPPLEIQYADYAQWQRDWLQGEELTRQVDFWQQHLAGAPALLELPLDRPRPAVQSYAGSSVPVTLSPELTARVRAFSQRNGVTPFMTLFTAWGLLLSRLSGQQDIVIGTPVANRQRREVENLIGFFVNTLAVRLRFDEQPSVAALLAQVKQTTLAAFANQDLPFEQVVEAMQPQRSLSHSPLAQVTFTWNNREHVQTDGSTLQLPGLALAPVSRASETIQVDLQLLLDDAGGAINGVLVYARDLFDGETIERWTGHFAQLLEAMVADAAVVADTLPLLSAVERRQLIETFNDHFVEYPQEALIHELFEQQAAQQPDAVAVVDENESLTYAELNVCANKLAHYLIGLGVKADDRVAVCCERNADLIVSLLGILKAGGAYVPLDPSHPRERLAWMLEDSAPVALLTHSDLEALLPETELPVLRVDVDLPVLTRRLPEHNPDVRGLSSANLVYVIYTSGSTGTPKGVMVEQRNVIQLVKARDYVALTRASVVAQASNASFDAATFEIWGALLNGGQLVIVGKETLIDPGQLQKRLVAERVDTLFVTTALFNRIAKSAPSAFATLETLLFGGEKVSPDTVAELLASGFRGRLLHVYGPTENTTYSTWYHVPNVGLDDGTTVPIGRGLAGARVYLLDTQRQPVPIGVAGEIYIGGAGVARGYLNRAELTAERFVRDPFSTRADARMYKTGDLGRWLPGGNVEFLARNDFQVKIRGFRVELGEIEAKLSACAGIREAIVVAREDEPGDKRLVAYLVADEYAELSVYDLREALSRQLPEYMVPTAFVQLDTLPLTANGKVDRKALPAPEATALGVREYEAPQGEIEEAIAALWQEQLKVPRVGRHDNFFELGGHSLLAVQLISHIRAALGVEVPLRDLFASPSLAALAEKVCAAGASTMGRIPRADRDRPLPLSLAQQRLWFLAQFDEAASAAYHMPAALRLLGNLDVAALRATLDRVVARHESLRTHFVAIDGVPFQRIASDGCSFELCREDLSSLPADEREAAVTRLTAEEARGPFDLSAGPLIRGRLLTLADDEHVLLITQHHIVSDGWSLGILVREVAALYAAFRRGEHDPLPPLAIQYADYAQWQRSWLRGEELTRQVEFWREQLTGAPALLELPLDHARPLMQSHAGSSVPLVLSPELTARLRVLSQGHGVTLFMTLLSAWGLLLSRLSGQQDVVIGTPVANRQRREVEGLIGFFVNTVAMRLRFDGEPTVATLLEQVKETTLAAFANQELPFEQVVEAVQPQRSLSHSPLVQTALALDNTADYGDALSLPDLSLIPLEQALATAPYELSLHLSEAGEGLSGSIVYASDLFDRSSVERWAGHYVRLLEAMVADATSSVEKLPLLSAAERKHLLRDFNAPDVSYRQDTLIHELFEQQAAARPDAVAVVFEDQSLSYSELDARANRLAQGLIALGVQPDDRVAICVERSLEMVVGLLGILKAGGAYVPLDPAYPVERLRYMLEDSAPVALLTQSRLQNLVTDLTSHAPVIDISATQLANGQSRLPVRASSVADHSLTPQHLAYVIYTSGSTGTPKGVMVEHGNVVRLFAATDPWFHFDDRDVWTMFHSYAFDFSVWEIWGALLYGGRLVIVPQETSRSPEELYGLVCRSGVTILNQTPSAFRQFIAAQRASDGEHHLRHVIFGGEALEVATLEPWFERHDDQRPRLVNMYGITETTVHVTYRLIDRADTRRGGSPIGRRIPDLAIYLLDAHRQPVPIGVVGELYIGGAGVARGYLNRPELTAERFLADPFAARDGARMYRSGDLGRWLPDGSIEFLGRNDAQVKIRGFRIELGEVEAKLSQCAGVREAVVLAREDVAGDKRLVAYLVADDGVTLQASELRAALLSQLPEYMVPSAFVEVDALPLTPNGKLDRKALPAPETTALTAREYEAPRDEIEEMLAAIWRELLRVGRVGRHDGFFELGGHSLLAVQLISRIRATLAVDVPLRELFAQPSLQALAEIIRRASASTMARIEIADRSQHLPLSMAQQRLWFLDQLDPAASAAYHMPAALRLLGQLDVAALQATLNRLIARHESLRTSFIAIDGVPYQQIAPEDCGFALSREDLRSLPAEESDRAVARLTAEEARALFDLSSGPLIRGRLLRVSDDEHVLLVTQHHIVTDGWSIGVM